MDYRKTVIWLTMLLATAGCTPPFEEYSFELRRDTEDPGVMTSDGVPLQDYDAPYRLDSDDIIRINVPDFPEFSGRMQIDHDGKIEVPLVEDRVEIAGLTEDEAKERYYQAISKYVSFKPTNMDVRLMEARSKAYWVCGVWGGGTSQPTLSRRPLGNQRVRLRDVLIDSGLASVSSAKLDTVYIISQDKYRPKMTKLNALPLIWGRLENNILIHPGDIVFVPTTYWSQINNFMEDVFSVWNRTQRFGSSVEDMTGYDMIDRMRTMTGYHERVVKEQIRQGRRDAWLNHWLETELAPDLNSIAIDNAVRNALFSRAMQNAFANPYRFPLEERSMYYRDRWKPTNFW